MGSMVGAMQPSLREANNQMNQQAFNQQLGRGVSNQMYQPPRSDYDPYTASRRPNYMPFGPNQQFYQPIYQPSYSQFSPMGYGQAPFGGFYQPPMMGFGQQFGQPQFGSMNFQGGDPGAFRNALIRQSERKGFGQPQQNMFGPATDISDQGQAALRQMPQPMLSPQPMQTQYRPIPYMTQTQIDAKAAADAAAAAPVNMGFSGDGAKAGGKVHGEGIDSLLRK